MIGNGARARALAEPLAVEEAVDPGQADVEQDRVGNTLLDQALRLDHVVGFAHLDSFQLERGANEFANRLVVIDHEHVLLQRHESPIST